VRSILRKLGLGRVLYWGLHRPRQFARAVAKEGGVLGYATLVRSRAQMQQAASALPPLVLDSNARPIPTPIYVLTGRRYWDQTAFCIHTLVRHLRRPVRLILIDDGSLEPSHVRCIARCGVEPEVIWFEQARSTLVTRLPVGEFPVLNRLWGSYVNLRKLVDPHLAHRGWKVVLDSDMLFHRHPHEFEHWLDSPMLALSMTDAVESYGYERSVLESLAGAQLPVAVNVGVTGLDGDALDWRRIESWCVELLSRHGSSYFLEQALVAMIVAGSNLIRLDAGRYRVMPDPAECRDPEATMHHYVDASRSAYVRDCWRRYA